MINPGDGERLEAQRRRRFWMTVGVLLASGLVVGLFVGANAAHQDVALDQMWSGLSRGIVIALAGFALISFAYGTWRFVKVIDEVELVDNLWGSTAAYYAYAVLFPLWWVLGKAGVVGQPDDWAIYAVALGAGGLVYLGRKWRAR